MLNKKDIIYLYEIFNGYVFIDIKTNKASNDYINETLEIIVFRINKESIEDFNITIGPKGEFNNEILQVNEDREQNHLITDVYLCESIKKLNDFTANDTIICFNKNMFLDLYYKHTGMLFSNNIIDIIDLVTVIDPYNKTYNLDTIAKNIYDYSQTNSNSKILNTYKLIYVIVTIIIKLLSTTSEYSLISINDLFDIIKDWKWTNIINRLISKKDILLDIKYNEHTVNIKVKPNILPSTNISIDILEDIYTCRKFYNNSYRYREQQKVLCKYMLDTIANKKIGIVEGPVGIGKSMAIALVSIIAAMHQNNKRIVIVTKTKSLMCAILNKELPAMKRTMGIDELKIAGLKGKSNYICLLKLNNIIKNGSIYSLSLDQRIIYVILYIQYLYGKIDIEDNDIKGIFLNEHIHLEDIETFIYQFRCDTTCDMSSCSYYSMCKFIEVYKRAEESNILVTNQSLLSKWPYLNIDMDIVIIDESHELIEEAKKLNTTTIDINIIKNTILKYMPKLNDLIVNSRSINENDKSTYIKDINLCINNAIISLDDLFNLHINNSIETNKNHSISKFIYEDEGNLITSIYNNIISICSTIVKLPVDVIANENLYSYLINVKEELENVLKFKENEISNILVDRFLNSVTINTYRQIETSNFYRKCLKNSQSTIFISGTLQVPDNKSCDSFNYFKSSIGLNGELKNKLQKELVIDPIYNYSDRLKIGIVKDACKYTPHNEHVFVKTFAKHIEEIALNAPSNVLVLFTSTKRKDMVYSILKSKLIEKNIDVYSSISDIGKLKVSGKKTVLLGTRGMFQGINLPGDRMNIVILEKLPNLFSEDPFIELERKINKCVKKNCYSCSNNCYTKINRRFVSILLQQIYGRVIRSDYDYGFFIVYNGLQSTGYLDSNYYKDLISSKDIRTNQSNIIEDTTSNLIKEFNNNIKPWIIDNIKNIIESDGERVKDTCLDNLANGLEYKEAFEYALSLELKNKNLDYNVQICLKDNGCIDGVKVIRKEIDYYIVDNIFIKIISRFSKEIRSVAF